MKAPKKPAKGTAAHGAAHAWIATAKGDRLRHDRESARAQAEREYFGPRGRPAAPPGEQGAIEP